jgi:hypothetical protein
MSDYPATYPPPSNPFDEKPVPYQQASGQPTNVVGPGNIYPGLVELNPELNNIENYQIWSIFNILCCCWILGCVACFFFTGNK